jgi:purine-binding chemotaxis protein CheW
MSDEQNTQNRYLVFHIENDFYATPLLGVREVVEYQTPKAIPNTANWFSGIINIRGEIIGVIDLRVRLGYSPRERANFGLALILFETDVGTLAATVDKIEAVREFIDEDIEKNPGIATRVPMEHLIGIGQSDHQMVNLIELNQILSRDEFAQFHRLRPAA